MSATNNKLLRVVIFLAFLGAPLGAQEEADRRAGEATSGMLRVAENAERLPAVIPTPQETYWGRGVLEIGRAGVMAWSVEVPALPLLRDELQKRLQRRFQFSPATGEGGKVRVSFTLDPAEASRTLRGLHKEAYVLNVRREPQPCVVVTGNSEAALWRGMATLVELITRKDDALLLPEVEIVDYPAMSDRAILVDMGGQGFMVGPSRWGLSQWCEFVDWMVDHKFNALWLEFIGSGRLMGNLNMDAGEWIGFPLALKSYPQLVCKDRPIRRWDAAQAKVVPDTYTAPNVKKDFVAELIDYAQARGVKCYLQIGYDYFANQLPVVLKLPANDPTNLEANKVYDVILKEITERYRNASGVVLCTIENKSVPPEIIQHIIRRTREAYGIIRGINPKMEVGVLADYLEWQPTQLDDIRLFRESVPPDVFFGYSPHREQQQKSWQRVQGDVWRYMNYTQYAWDHVVYCFPDRIREEVRDACLDGYRKVVTQGWYFDAFAMNYLAQAEYSWNANTCPVETFWNKALEEQFGSAARDLMRTALEHTRFDIRFDIVARMILEDKIEGEFTYWDMYVLHHFNGLTDAMLETLESDARQSLTAAQKALDVVPAAARETVEMTIVSAERRLYLASSARHLLKALAHKKSNNLAAARSEMDECLREAGKLRQAATRLGIEFPISVHDDKVVEKYRRIQKSF